MNEAPRDTLADLLRHLFVVVAWLVGFRLLADNLVRLLPLALARRMSLMSYLTGVQLVVLALGLAMSFLMLRQPRAALGFVGAAPTRVLTFVVLSPAIYVAASYLAIAVALPTLLAELEAAGRQVVQQQTGELGHELGTAGLAGALVWGVIVSPLGEEAMFRGGLWSLVQRGIDALRARLERDGARPPSSQALPSGVLEEGLGLKASRSLARFFLTGGVATVVSAAVFAWMHADTPGGLGIVRWMSALGLGLAAGVGRHATGSLLAPVGLHVCFNLWSLAVTRRWFVTRSFGSYLGVPKLLTAIAVSSAVVVLLASAAVHFRKRSGDKSASVQ